MTHANLNQLYNEHICDIKALMINCVFYNILLH